VAIRSTGIELLVCFNPENTYYILNDFNAIDFSTPLAAILLCNIVQSSILICSSKEVDVLHTLGECLVYTYSVSNGALSKAAYWLDAFVRIFATLLNSSLLMIGIECSIKSDYCDVLSSLACKLEFMEIDGSE